MEQIPSLLKKVDKNKAKKMAIGRLAILKVMYVPHAGVGENKEKT